MKFNVPGMSCEHCIKRIETAVKTIPGVKKININLKNKIVEISGTATEEEVTAAIKEAGYEPSPV